MPSADLPSGGSLQLAIFLALGPGYVGIVRMLLHSSTSIRTATLETLALLIASLRIGCEENSRRTDSGSKDTDTCCPVLHILREKSSTLIPLQVGDEVEFLALEKPKTRGELHARKVRFVKAAPEGFEEAAPAADRNPAKFQGSGPSGQRQQVR